MANYQHYVQKAYLREFTKDNLGFFYNLNTKTNWTKIVHINNVCGANGYFDINNQSTKNRFGIDNPEFLEGKGFQIFEKYITNKFDLFKRRQPYIMYPDVEYIVVWYLMSKLRNPYYIRVLSSDSAKEQLYDRAIQSVNDELTFEEIEVMKSNGLTLEYLANEIKRKSLSDPNHDKDLHLNQLLEATFNVHQPFNQTVVQFMAMNIEILEAGEGDYFIVTDNPGYTIKYIDGLESAGVYNADFLNFQAVFFPINSKQALLFNGRDFLFRIQSAKAITYRQLSTEEVRAFNEGSMYVISSDIFCESKEYLKGFSSK